MLTADEYSAFDATALVELVNTGELTAVELAEAAYEAHERVNPCLNATAELYLERIDKPAEQNSSALGGIPFLLKDAGSAEADKPQHCGSRLGQGYIAAADDLLVARYRTAGANIIGRTTTPELVLAATTESALTGATHNPWQLSHSAGGSSGGAAAAVAAGVVPLAHGTDIGGSIRIPAACCGVVGFKPSHGRVPTSGTNYAGLLAEHVLTRTVRDSQLLFALTADHPRVSINDKIPLRVAVWETSPFDTPVDWEIAATVDRVANLLSNMGHKVEAATPPLDLNSWNEADHTIWTMSTAREIERLTSATGHPATTDNLERPSYEAFVAARDLTLADWENALTVCAELRRQSVDFFASYDVLLTPTTVTPAPTLDSINANRDVGYEQFMRQTADFAPHTAPFNVTGQPAISLPLGEHSSGLPIGIQLVGNFGEDELLLWLSATLETALPWYERLPPNHVAAPTDAR